MEIIARFAVYFFSFVFLTGFSITALTGSARIVKYLLGILAILFIAGAVIGFIASGGLVIFLLPQLIVLMIIIFFVIIAGALCGGGMHMLIHKTAPGEKIDPLEIGDYLPLDDFAGIEGISEERTFSRIKSGFYRGGLHQGDWYVHKSELS